MARQHRITGAVLALLLLAFASAGRAEEPGEGYDENTEVTVQGTVREILIARHGPVIVRIIAVDRKYSAVTAPHWYLERERISFTLGGLLEVTGSKVFGKDGALYIICRKIRDPKTGQETLLRDTALIPLWHHKGKHGMTER